MRYSIAFGVGLILSLLFAIVFGIFQDYKAVIEKWNWDVISETNKNMFSLTNATFVSGTLLTCFGLLVLAADGGAFDMLVYGIRRFISLFQKDVNKIKFKTFYDYRVYKDSEPKRSFLYLVLIGIFYLLLSGLFLLLYYKTK